LPKTSVGLAVLGIESGFETGDAAIISEQDILGDRLVRPRRAARRAENFIAEATSLAPGDLVVHVDHGIGRFAGLQPIEVAGAPHDCLEIHYAEGAKLYLPVENVDLLSRYGSEEATVDLDRLGGWQLAGAQGAHEEPYPGDRGRADQDRRGTPVARGAPSDGGSGRL
jgi:transcription-repair coupling factor (superfamily II helicase)